MPYLELFNEFSKKNGGIVFRKKIKLYRDLLKNELEIRNFTIFLCIIISRFITFNMYTQ